LKICSSSAEYGRAIHVEDGIYNHAVDSEMARPGSGTATLLRYLAEQQATGPSSEPRRGDLSGPDTPQVTPSQTRRDHA